MCQTCGLPSWKTIDYILPEMKKTLLILLVSLLSVYNASMATAVGEWRTFLAYGSLSDIEVAGDKVYALTEGDLFSYNTSDGSITTYDRQSGLSGVVMTHIAFCKATGTLVAVYDDGSIDLIDEKGVVESIPDYRDKTMTEDKTINGITIDGHFAYLATGFGVVKVNVRDAIIANSYNLGFDVKSVAKVDDNVFVASLSQGMWMGNENDNLLDRSFWKRCVSDAFLYLFNLNGVLYTIDSGRIRSYDITTGNLSNAYPIECTFAKLCGDRILALDANRLHVVHSMEDATTYRFPSSALTAVALTSEKTIWGNNGEGALTLYNNTSEELTQQFLAGKPDGPEKNYFTFMRVANNRLYTLGGALAENRRGVVQMFDFDTSLWTNFQHEGISDKTGVPYYDLVALSVDPGDKNHVMASGINGLYEFNEGKFTRFYGSENSIIEPYDGQNKDYVFLTGLLYQSDRSLLCLNSRAPSQALLSLSSDGKWSRLPHKELMVYNGKSMATMSQMIKDSRDLVWFVNDNYTGPALVCYQPSTDGIKTYTSFVNDDGNSVGVIYARCVVEDLRHNMWVGTNAGPLYLPASSVGGSDDTFVQVKVPRNDGTSYADYLLENIDILSMAVDAAGRKWFGTADNGVYLISEDNMEQIEHFTTDNSPLPANDIRSIAINNATGEVFFGTGSGLCSYQSLATPPSDHMDKDNVYAYPNPVRPDYTGPIIVTGLTLDADVKIVTTNGVLVAKGRSTGGSFQWDGCDLSGRPVVSGIYFVETATSAGSSGTVCKIAVVR